VNLSEFLARLTSVKKSTTGGRQVARRMTTARPALASPMTTSNLSSSSVAPDVPRTRLKVLQLSRKQRPTTTSPHAGASARKRAEREGSRDPLAVRPRHCPAGSTTP
jgi:hypothetical protein